MSTIILKQENKNEERLRLQEIAVFSYIATHLVEGVYKQANQFTANAVLEGERKTVERTVRRLIDKKVIQEIPPVVPMKDAPAVLRPVSFSAFWRLYWSGRQDVQQSQNALDKPSKLSSGEKGALSSGKTLEESMTSVPRPDSSCPATKQRTYVEEGLGRVHNSNILIPMITGDCIQGPIERCSAAHVGVSSGQPPARCPKCNDAIDSPHHRNVCRKDLKNQVEPVTGISETGISEMKEIL